MSTLSDIRSGVVANLRTAYPDGVQIGEYAITNPSPPSLQILVGSLTYHQAMGHGFDQCTLTIQGLASLSQQGQQQLDDWMDPEPGGVKDAVEADSTLAGVAQTLIVRSCSGTRIASVGGIDYLLAEWLLDVYPKGS